MVQTSTAVDSKKRPAPQQPVSRAMPHRSQGQVLKLQRSLAPAELNSPLLQERIQACMRVGIKGALAERARRGRSTGRPVDIDPNGECTRYLEQALNLLVLDTLAEVLGLCRHREEGESRRPQPQRNVQFQPESDSVAYLATREAQVQNAKMQLRHQEHDLELHFQALTEKENKTSSRKKRNDAAPDEARKREIEKREKLEPGVTAKELMRHKGEILNRFTSGRSASDQRIVAEAAARAPNETDRALDSGKIEQALMSFTQQRQVVVTEADMRSFWSDFPSRPRQIWNKVLKAVEDDPLTMFD